MQGRHWYAALLASLLSSNTSNTTAPIQAPLRTRCGAQSQLRSVTGQATSRSLSIDYPAAVHRSPYGVSWHLQDQRMHVRGISGTGRDTAAGADPHHVPGAGAGCTWLLLTGAQRSAQENTAGRAGQRTYPCDVSAASSPLSQVHLSIGAHGCTRVHTGPPGDITGVRSSPRLSAS